MKQILSVLIILMAFLPVAAKKYASFSVLGDSYSTYKGYVVPDTNFVWYADTPLNLTDVTNVKDTWWSRLVEKTGIKLDKNNSFSGSTVCNRGYRGEDYSDRSFITRMDKLGNPELIIVFGATNDSWAKAPVEGNDDKDLYALRPALSYLFEGLRRNYPSADVVFVLNDDLSGKVDKAVLEKCAEYGVPCLQLELIDKISGHPSVAGMKKICDQITEFIEKL